MADGSHICVFQDLSLESLHITLVAAKSSVSQIALCTRISKLKHITENVPDILTTGRLFPSRLLDPLLRIIGWPLAIIGLEVKFLPLLLLSLRALVEYTSQFDVLEVFTLLASRLLQLCT